LIQVAGVLTASVLAGYVLMKLTVPTNGKDMQGTGVPAMSSEKMQHNREFMQHLNKLAQENAKLPTRRTLGTTVDATPPTAAATQQEAQRKQ
jgi:hypothetical protein